MNFCLKISLVFLLSAATTFSQSYMLDIKRDSARSDKITGGRIEKASLVPGGDIRLTINVPAFQLTLWQGSKEIKSYPIGVGMREFPIFIGRLSASSIEWNPVWIPPSSDWIDASSTVKPGEIVLPTDPRNPLGKIKIPLGYGYLLHQAKSAADMGNLVSHGCVRVKQADLYDLAEKIVAARELNVTSAQITATRANKKTLIADLDPAIPIEITYDTIVVESGRLHIYPDVYSYRKNTVASLREELKTSGIDDSRLSDKMIKEMLARAVGKRQFTVKTSDVNTATFISRGQVIAVLANAADTPKKAATRKRSVKR